MDTLGKKTHYSSQVISLVLMLYFSSNGVSSILLSFHKTYKSTFRQRNYFQHKLMSLQITFLLFLFMVVSSAFVIVGNLWLEKLFDYLSFDFVSRFLIYILKWLVVTMVIYIIVALLYKFGPAMKKNEIYQSWSRSSHFSCNNKFNRFFLLCQQFQQLQSDIWITWSDHSHNDMDTTKLTCPDCGL